MLDKKIDKKEAHELEKICDLSLDKGNERMKNTLFKVEVVLGDVLRKEAISPQQITKLKTTLAKMM